ncbi:protein unzipped-like [Palaemon carinicauda]|uniref:protein unzipped-like n=1 Tax=Palaemon carinicauda TaxID=392227 RepID=UPI0035B66653
MALIIGARASLDMAQIRQEGGRIITSSTLAWLEGSSRGHPHAVQVNEDDPVTVWCRAQKHTHWMAGSMQGGVCTVPYFNNPLRASDKFEILISVNGSAKVRYMEWDRYLAPPHNAVAAQAKLFLAVRTGENGYPEAGFLSPVERRVHLVSGNSVEVVDKAMVLVEDQPVRYDLRGVNLDTSRTSVKHEDKELASAKLLNPGPTRQHVVEARDVVVAHLSYWGQVKGTYTGLPAHVVSPPPDNDERDIYWGIQNEFDSAHRELLEYSLPPGTGVNVKMIGTIRKTEAPYYATLTAVYEDGDQTSRVIEGLHMDRRLILLRAEYSRPYFLNNNTELDIAEQSSILYKSTTTTTTTSTSTTTTTTPDPPKISMVGPEKPKSDSLSTTSEQELVVTLNSSGLTKARVSLVFLPSLLLAIVTQCLSTMSP